MRTHSLLFTLIFASLVVSCKQEAVVDELDFSDNVLTGNQKEKSVKAFKKTVQPIVMKNCASCHGDGGAHIGFAVSDSVKAHDLLIESGKVNLGKAASSRLVQRLASDKHNCWGDCSSNSSEMEAAINEWIKLSNSRGIASVKGAKTGLLGFADLESRLPQTENGTVLLQAEDGVLEGRMKAYTNSTASGFKGISGDLPPVHPFGGTARIPAISGSCRTVTNADLQETVNGRFQISEPRRHVGQDGYSYYSLDLDGRIIRPDKRTEYQAAIKAGQTTMADLQKFFLRTGAPNRDNPQMLDGNDIVFEVMEIVPEFKQHAAYLTDVHNSTSTASKNFYAPRFGVTGVDYYNATNEEIRTLLTEEQKKGIAYRQLMRRYRRLFFRSDYTTPNRVRDVPFTLRTMPDGNGGTTNYSENATVAQQFLDHYFPLSENDSILDLSGTDSTDRIDTYTHYFIDPASREVAGVNGFGDVTHVYYTNGVESKRDTFDISRGNVKLDLANFFVGEGATDQRSIFVKNFGPTLHTILKANCAGCHGDNGNNLEHAVTNPAVAYDAIGGMINFGNPAQSRPVQRMDEGHNCGGSCQALKNDMINAINNWNNLNQTDIANAQNDPSANFRALTEAERTPGRAKYKIKITEAGDYNLWLKVLTPETNRRDFNIRIVDEQGRPVPNCRANENCAVNDETYRGKSAATIDAMGCVTMDPGTHTQWSWYTPDMNNAERRRKWTLAEGVYTIEVVEREVGAKLDMIALSKNPEFNPAKNLIDEGFISDAAPSVLKYDISNLLGAPGFFEIELKEKDGDSYVFRNPRFTGNNLNIKVRNIKVLVNEEYEFNNSTYTEIDRVVGQGGKILTYAPLVALSILGKGTDKIGFAFEDLQTTGLPPSQVEDDAPKPIEGRVCNNLNLFKESVMPILNRIRLVLKDSNQGYMGYRFPGSDRDGTDNPVFYTCTTCHTENHPYFKMTTYFDDAETLCAQALSRVDFGNFERSLLLRGINGTFTHPKLHFAESVEYEGSGTSRRLKKNANKVNGFESSWLGLRIEKYQEGNGPEDINLAGQTGENLAYLRKFIGQYKRARYTTIDDPFSVLDGEIRTINDTVDQNGVWTYVNTGQNVFETVNPMDYLARKNDLNPNSPTSGGVLKMKSACFGRGFDENNGLITDPCNNDVDAEAEFEAVKSRYREAVINWMKEEKKSYQANN